jgi:hypothetical protein
MTKAISDLKEYCLGSQTRQFLHNREHSVRSRCKPASASTHNDRVQDRHQPMQTRDFKIRTCGFAVLVSVGATAVKLETAIREVAQHGVNLHLRGYSQFKREKLPTRWEVPAAD